METDQHISLRVRRALILMSKINPSRTICGGPTEQKVFVCLILLNILGVTFVRITPTVDTDLCSV
jgi:hypothetical protein